MIDNRLEYEKSHIRLLKPLQAQVSCVMSVQDLTTYTRLPEDAPALEPGPDIRRTHPTLDQSLFCK